VTNETGTRETPDVPPERRLWPCVIDTNVLIHYVSQKPEQQAEREAARRALLGLVSREHPLYTVPVVLMEFWRVARRGENGLGLTAQEARDRFEEVRLFSTCLLETPEVLSDWYGILKSHDLPSAQVYDAYIAAFLRVHPTLQGQSDERGPLYPRLLTFNGNDFHPYAGRQLFRVVPPRDIEGP
jgi:predicted nucleic acid-binding protein